MNVEFWNSVFQVGSLALVLATFAFGAGALWTGNRINKRQSNRLLVLESDLTKARTQLGEQQERTANAEKDAAEAKTVSAEAGEGTLRALAEVAAANERAAKLELEAGEQRERAANAERELIALRHRIEPRTIGRANGTRLIEALKNAHPKGTVDLTCVLGDGEGAAFAEQLDQIIKASGWPTTGVSQAAYTGGNPTGWGIIVHSLTTIPPFATSLQKAFADSGFPLAIVEKAEIAPGHVLMLVGNKQ